MENDTSNQSPYKSHFFIIGAMMLIGGLGQLYMKYHDEVDANLGSIIIPIITSFGGLAFIIVAFKGKN